MMKKLAFLILAVAILPAMALAADPNKSQVVTFKSNITACLASVAIKQVDGHQRQLPTMGFEIEPGWHTMHGTATVNLRHCPVNEERIRKTVNVPPLEWLFEAGKVYYVGLDHSSPERRNWQLVVWKVEDMEGAEEDQSQGVNSP
jgi:hypothetical protein